MKYQIQKSIVSPEHIALRIVMLRGSKVMLDSDLAILYGVETKALNLAVKRNAGRFPKDFMYHLTAKEVANLRFQFETSSSVHGGRRYRPYAFTEQGVAMLSSVINSERAVQVNIAIMRAFVKLRKVLETNAELAKKFAQLETRLAGHDEQIADIIEAIRQLMAPPPASEKREIGFHIHETPPPYRVGRRSS